MVPDWIWITASHAQVDTVRKSKCALIETHFQIPLPFKDTGLCSVSLLLMCVYF